MTTFNTKQEVLPNIMWIMDKVFMYTNFGIVSVIHKDFFIGSVSGCNAHQAIPFFVWLLAFFFVLIRVRDIARPRSWNSGRTSRKLTFQDGASGWFCSRRAAFSKRDARRVSGKEIGASRSVTSFSFLDFHFRYANKNNLPVLNHVTLPRHGAMKTIIDVLGPGQDEDPAASTTPPQSMKDLNKVINGEADEFYIDNEYTNQQSPPSTPLRNAYNVNNHSNNNKPMQRIISDDENLKEKLGEAEISARKTIKYVLDITIAYPDGEPLDLPNIVTGMRRACQTHLLYRLYRCSEVRDSRITSTMEILMIFFCLRFHAKTKRWPSGWSIGSRRRKSCWRTSTAPARSRIQRKCSRRSCIKICCASSWSICSSSPPRIFTFKWSQCSAISCFRMCRHADWCRSVDLIASSSFPLMIFLFTLPAASEAPASCLHHVEREILVVLMMFGSDKASCFPFSLSQY